MNAIPPPHAEWFGPVIVTIGAGCLIAIVAIAVVAHRQPAAAAPDVEPLTAHELGVLRDRRDVLRIMVRSGPMTEPAPIGELVAYGLSIEEAELYLAEFDPAEMTRSYERTCAEYQALTKVLTPGRADAPPRAVGATQHGTAAPPDS